MSNDCKNHLMKKHFATYEISLKLRVIGFDEPCFGYYDDKKKFEFIIDSGNDPVLKNQLTGSSIVAPLWQQVIDWLREKHKMEINIDNYYRNTVGYKPEYQIFINGKQQSFEYSSSSSVELHSKYEDAREAGVLKAIQLIRTNGFIKSKTI